MDFMQSDQFTQRVEQIINNYFRVSDDTNPCLSEIYKKIEQLQQQLIETQFTLLQYLKQSFETLKEQMILDTETIQFPNISVSSLMNHQLQPQEMKNKEFEKRMESQIALLQERVDAIQLNRDELQEEMKSFDTRIDSQWQGLANVTDQFWVWKKELEPLLQHQSEMKKKRFALF